MNGTSSGGDDKLPKSPSNGLGSDDPTIPGEQLRPDPRAEAEAAQADRASAIDRRDLTEPWGARESSARLPFGGTEAPTFETAEPGFGDGQVLSADEAGPLPVELDGATDDSLTGPRSRRIVMFVIAALMVVGVVGAAIIVLAKRDPGDGASPAATLTAGAPSGSASPTGTASETTVPTDSAAFDLLPAKVGAFNVISATEVESMTAGGAKEAYEVGYSDGTDEVTVIVGSWDSAEKASAWANATAAAFAPETLEDSGEVDLDDAGPGHFWQYTTATGQEIIWTKGVRAMAFVGPNGATQALYSQFPF